MCVPSNTIVLPRGLICANPLGSTLPTRQTLAGKAVLMWGCRISGIFAIKPPPVLLHSRACVGDLGAQPPSRQSFCRRTGALLKPAAGKTFQCLDHKGNIGLQSPEAAGLFQRFLVHVE